MSGYVSPFPSVNGLYGSRQGEFIEQRHNSLLADQAQQQIGATDNEMAARIAQSMLTMDEAKAAELYPGFIREAQGRGLLRNAPSIYPGHERARVVAALGVPVKDQYERQGLASAAAGVDLGGRAGGGGAPLAPAPPGAYGQGGTGSSITVPPAYIPFYQEASQRTGIPVEVLIAQHRQESGFNPNATGAAGEIGIGQIHPNTARSPGYGMAGVDPATLRDPRTNINFAADYLKARGGGGNWADPEHQRRALAAYNGGGDPNYVTNVTRYLPAGYGGAATQTATAAPGAPAGGGGPPPGVQMGGAPPGPPGAAPRPYVGGGFGTALNPVAPVVQAPPAPGGGTASNVPGYVTAMQGGMARAQNTPVAGVQTAGPGAPTGGAQVASVEPPPQAGWGTAVGSYGDGAAAAPPAAPPGAPVAPRTTQQPSPATAPAQMPAELRTNEVYLTPRDVDEFDNRRRNLRTKEQYQQWLNDLEQRKAANERRQRDWQAQEHTARTEAATATQREVENKRQADAAAALAEQRRLENARAGVPTGMQRNDKGVLEPIPGFRGATAEERINYALKNDPPDSQEYTDAWRAKKWQMAPNGSVIEADMSEYPPPTRSVRRPTFLPQPTGTALDEVRKADTDARVIVPSIDRYVDLHKKIGGSSWGAYFDNPKDPKAQQLIGAFNAMKTVLRSPTYANTGVLQPAEMEMLKQELVSPQTIRGLYASPQALEARLHEIKFAILSRQDAELRSVGRDGVIVRSQADLASVPDGGKFYDEDGNLRVKTKAEK